MHPDFYFVNNTYIFFLIDKKKIRFIFMNLLKMKLLKSVFKLRFLLKFRFFENFFVCVFVINKLNIEIVKYFIKKFIVA